MPSGHGCLWLNLVDPIERHDVVGSVLDIPHPGAVGVYRDDSVVRVPILTGADYVASPDWRPEVAGKIAHIEVAREGSHGRIRSLV